jgi:hypothetical protein
MKIMLQELKDAVRKVGLELHPGKTKILLNQFACEGTRPKNLDAGGSKVEVLAAAASTKYLGRLLNITSPSALHETEISNRIAVAWRKFWANKRELCDKSFKLRHRLRFFDQVITPSLLYASGCWTLTVELKHKLRTCQRQMLRKILNTKRLKFEMDYSPSSLDSSSTSMASLSTTGNIELEGWIDYIIRATRVAEGLSKRFGVRDWVAEHYRLKFRLAGHVARREDGRWSEQVLHFRPRDGSRQQGHPCKRWSDDLEHFFGAAHGLQGGQWKSLVTPREQWHALEEVFVAFHVR